MWNDERFEAIISIAKVTLIRIDDRFTITYNIHNVILNLT